MGKGLEIDDHANDVWQQEFWQIAASAAEQKKTWNSPGRRCYLTFLPIRAVVAHTHGIVMADQASTSKDTIEVKLQLG